MKLSQYAEKVGIHYRTAYRWFKAGEIKGYQLPTGTIIITEDEQEAGKNRKVVIYARVSSSEMRSNLDRQVDRLINYCNAKGWKVTSIVKEIGSGVNDKRPKLNKLLKDETITTIVVEHKDRLTRFGFNYIATLLARQNVELEVVNPNHNDKDDLVADLIAIIYSFSARLYGQRRAKRKTERIKIELEKEDE